ncbi:stage V sporulation protein S [Keratinibaculum paraultunense]|uniref:Stage V sporulation protein S n=1 Tax=Keratinibaculum paraultunense TaxID=1278232 RepID=A0A4R3L365_9FIRM|nr:stage V sporulation protein S [Keratinibaculum paraultunense]QQY79934.1 stage V sporulation protein S [Keratinibaculum paraultunense]TCS91747.1 stage V sporulation protein S [Keratinibaculum paraultunense]
MTILKVASDSKPASVAGALLAALEKEDEVALQAIGAGAVNQAIKAIASARNFITSDEVDLITIPAFVDVEIDGENRTAMRLIVETREKEQSIEEDVELEKVEEDTKEPDNLEII